MGLAIHLDLLVWKIDDPIFRNQVPSISAQFLAAVFRQGRIRDLHVLASGEAIALVISPRYCAAHLPSTSGEEFQQFSL
jgi:hypothetical protein